MLRCVTPANPGGLPPLDFAFVANALDSAIIQNLNIFHVQHDNHENHSSQTRLTNHPS
jgi:hypothetical protein